MTHIIEYKSSESDWREALPIGNGIYGAMGYFNKNRLTFAMNHYEIYYKIYHRYSETYKNEGKKEKDPLYTYKELEKIAKEHYTNYNKEPINGYFETLFNYSSGYGHPLDGVSQLGAGELTMVLSEEIENVKQYKLALEIEEATLKFEAKKQDKLIETETIIANKKDLMLTSVRQSQKGLINSLKLSYPRRRLQTDFKCQFKVLSERCIGCEVSFYPGGEKRDKYAPFVFMIGVGVIGAKVELEVEGETDCNINILEEETDFKIVTMVLTKENKEKTLEEECKNWLEYANKEMDEIKGGHKKKWESFFEKSKISIPDKFLEKLWYMGLYTLESSSGKDGVMYQEACGLNGLWDIKQPTRWGSLWYWDVNIQSAFSPVYAANQEHLVEVFCKAFLTYIEEGKAFAKRVYGYEACAIDYPHALYNCIMPWCAQYLWWNYQYFGDIEFLRQEAYPVFVSLLEFIEKVIKWDEVRQEYYIYPDISPEQGPLTRNSTITIATIKYLVEITLKCLEILQVSHPKREQWEKLLRYLPEYATEQNGKYGRTLKDSEYAPPRLWLRHPSVLMPIYPIGEINQHSQEEIREVALNTLRYVEENSEIGVFVFGWLASAAARMGKGNMAIRVLYEKGIDLMLRPNGMWSEETERWSNYCNTGFGYLYYPCMMEAGGGVVAAINEMLLQSYDGIIDVFPALPNGEIEEERFKGKYYHGIKNTAKIYPKWENVEFEKLRAVGGYEVSSRIKAGKFLGMIIKASQDGMIRVRNKPLLQFSSKIYKIEGNQITAVDYTVEQDIIQFKGEKGSIYRIGNSLEQREEKTLIDNQVYSHQSAHLYRSIFLGKNKDTDYIKTLESVVFNRYLGNKLQYEVSIHKFDFGEKDEKRSYEESLHRQVYEGDNIGGNFIQVDNQDLFSTYKGFGFLSNHTLKVGLSTYGDSIRKSYIEGEGEVEFCLELPRGKYDLFIVCGDFEEESYTEVIIDKQIMIKSKEVLGEGEFLYEVIPIIVKEDKYLTIGLRSKKNYKWKINALIVNKIHSL